MAPATAHEPPCFIYTQSSRLAAVVVVSVGSFFSKRAPEEPSVQVKVPKNVICSKNILFLEFVNGSNEHKTHE